jgi:CheY-like chemotaxis protein
MDNIAHSDASKSGNVSPTTSSQAVSQRKTILICDDLKDIVQVCALSLRSKFGLLSAESGKECISVYSKAVRDRRQIDVVLLDYRLGDMTGEDVARKIKEIRATKIVLMTAFELDSETISRLKEGGFIVADIKKPFSLRELHKIIDFAISKDLES